MKIARFLKGSRLGRWLAVALCALVLTYATPRKAEATAVEYAVMLALIIVVCITAITESPGTNEAWHMVGNQLLTASTAAQDANSEGDQPKEIAGLSKTLGAAKAMMALASSCDVGDCATVKDYLRVIIGTASALKARVLNMASSCNPDGVIVRGEACDPLLEPSGCPDIIPGTQIQTSCSDECLCEPVTNIIP
jgi:Flp pilus assembly pilin Flp